MQDNKIINFSDIKKIHDNKIANENQFWKNISDIIGEDTGDFYLEDIHIDNDKNVDIPWPQNLNVLSFTPVETIATFLINDMVKMGLNPADPKISEDMVIISMLYSSAVIEYLSDAYLKDVHGKTNNLENNFYRWFDEMRNNSLTNDDER